MPPVDEHIVTPETTRMEIVRGRRVIALPAHEPHGDRHCELDFVVRAHVRPGYVSSTDLLTRFSAESNFATDTCVRRAGINVETGHRWLEEIAFEIAHTQSKADLIERAEDVTRRGVRRLFAIFVKENAVKEWSADARAFRTLDPDGVIEDPSLARPIPVRALLSAAEADDAVARAILAKGTPAVQEAAAAWKAKGEAAGKADAVLTVLAARGVRVSDDIRGRILACSDAAELDALLTRAATISSADELLSKP
jgi:hypothetical protein